jgi:thymidylate synthase
VSFSHTEAWIRMLEQVQEKGDPGPAPRGQPTRELTFTQHHVSDPLSFPLRVRGRELRDVIGVLEGLSLVGEFSVPELFTDRVAKFSQFMDEGVLWGAYGQRSHGSIGDIVELLFEDPDSRQAVVTFYDSKRDLYRSKRDIPCTISGQFLLRGGKIDLGISMRSNDLWLGTPYDLVQFSILQASVAQALGVGVGTYHHRVGSLHLYDRDASKAETVAFEGGPSMPFPLWGTGASAGHIQSRARMLALGQLEPETEFERWAKDLLDG